MLMQIVTFLRMKYLVIGVLVRHASKTAGGISKNKRTPSRKIPRGFKVEEGDAVHKGQVLATQLQLRYYPGENVSQCKIKVQELPF